MNGIGEKFGFILFLFTMMNISSSPHPLILILCYVVHEAGHLFFAKLLKASVTDFKTSLCRLSIKYDCSGISYGREALVCGGGIIFNFLFALIFSLPVFKGIEQVAFFVLCNISLGLMNLYPVGVLDGGNVVKCITSSFFDEERSKKICSAISFAFAFVLWLFAVYLQLIFSADVSIFFISVFLLVELCFSV